MIAIGLGPEQWTLMPEEWNLKPGSFVLDLLISVTSVR